MLTEFFRDFHDARQLVVAGGRSRNPMRTVVLDEWVATASTAELLADVVQAGGSNRRSVVELGGIEPPTSPLSVLLLWSVPASAKP